MMMMINQGQGLLSRISEVCSIPILSLTRHLNVVVYFGKNRSVSFLVFIIVFLIGQQRMPK